MSKKSSIYKIILPLHVEFPLIRKKNRKVSFSWNSFMLDLSDKSSRYKPNHFYEKKAKKQLQDIVRDQLMDITPVDFDKTEWPLKAKLTVYRVSNRRVDIDNFGVLIKFALDVLKEEHLPDDNFKYISSIEIVDGGLDRESPRAELDVCDIKK